MTQCALANVSARQPGTGFFASNVIESRTWVGIMLNQFISFLSPNQNGPAERSTDFSKFNGQDHSRHKLELEAKTLQSTQIELPEIGELAVQREKCNSPISTNTYVAGDAL